jgi:hypothetical protein
MARPPARMPARQRRGRTLAYRPVIEPAHHGRRAHERTAGDLVVADVDGPYVDPARSRSRRRARRGLCHDERVKKLLDSTTLYIVRRRSRRGRGARVAARARVGTGVDNDRDSRAGGSASDVDGDGS